MEVADSSKKECTKKGYNPSQEQKKTMVEYLKNRPNVISGKFSNAYTFKDAEREWVNLSNVLNSIPGANKNWKQWRKTWQDMRSRTKSKCSKNRNNMLQTGGGFYEGEPLTPTEEDIVEIIKPVSIEGHKDVQESVVEFNMESSSSANKENEESTAENKAEKGKQLGAIPIETPKVRVRRVHKRTPTLSKNILSATESYQRQLERKNDIKENYYQEKITLLKQLVAVTERSSIALEKLAEGLEGVAQGLENL